MQYVHLVSNFTFRTTTKRQKNDRMRNDAIQTSLDKPNRFTCTVQL